MFPLYFKIMDKLDGQLDDQLTNRQSIGLAMLLKYARDVTIKLRRIAF